MAEKGDVIFMETGRQRRELLKEERRWQELHKEEERQRRERRWQEQHAEKGTDNEDTGKGKGKVKPNLDLWRSGGSGSGQGNRGPQAGCRISNPWWVDRAEGERQRGEGG
jgi:hypothetical protein